MKVFISYHRADVRQKNRLIKELKLRRIKYYVVPDNANFNGIHNQTICQQILAEMNKCDVVICLVGKETYSRPHVDHELKYALHKRMGMVALLIENRGDSINNMNKSIYPSRLSDNGAYVVLSQFASGLNNIEELIEEAKERADSKININNTRKCLELRDKSYYDN